MSRKTKILIISIISFVAVVGIFTGAYFIFKRKPTLPTYFVTTTTSNGGSIDLSTVEVEEGGVVTYTVTSDDGYHIKSITIGDKVVVVENDLLSSYSQKIKDINSNQTIKVDFAKNLSVNISDNSINGSAIYQEIVDYAYVGKNVEILITTVENINVDNNSISYNSPIKSIVYNNEIYYYSDLIMQTEIEGIKIEKKSNTQYLLSIYNVQSNVNVKINMKIYVYMDIVNTSIGQWIDDLDDLYSNSVILSNYNSSINDIVLQEGESLSAQYFFFNNNTNELDYPDWYIASSSNFSAFANIVNSDNKNLYFRVTIESDSEL